MDLVIYATLQSCSVLCRYFSVLNKLNLFFFSAWGESFFMSVQDAMLVMLYFYYSNQSGMTFLFLPAYAASFYVLSSGIAPLSVLTKLQAMCVVIMAASKVNIFLLICMIGAIFVM